jgi:hypothetical protein
MGESYEFCNRYISQASRSSKWYSTGSNITTVLDGYKTITKVCSTHIIHIIMLLLRGNRQYNCSLRVILYYVFTKKCYFGFCVICFY